MVAAIDLSANVILRKNRNDCRACKEAAFSANFAVISSTVNEMAGTRRNTANSLQNQHGFQILLIFRSDEKLVATPHIKRADDHSCTS